MRFKRFFLSMLLILSLILFFPLTASAASAGNIIWNLLNYYGHYQQAAETDITLLLSQLRQLDPEKAEDWQLVLEHWHQSATSLEITPDVLRDGLPQDDSLCIVVMGFELNHDGSMKDELLGRLNTALASAEKYPCAYILCTGGGTAAGNRMATEAGKMAQWLTDQGIDANRIIVEDKSISSEQNATYSLKILRDSYPHVDSLALISSDYHLRRCHVLFHAALILGNVEKDYSILGNAGFEAGYEGDEGFLVEAECVGLIANTQIRNTHPPVLAQLTRITLQADPSGDPETLTVTAYYDKDITRDVTAKAVISGYDPAQSGVQVITAEYTENDRTATASMEVTVIAPPTEQTFPSTEEPTAPRDTAPATEPAISEPLSTRPQRRSLSPMILLLPLSLALAAAILLARLIRQERRRRRRRRRKNRRKE